MHPSSPKGTVWVVSSDPARREQIARLLAPQVESALPFANADAFLGAFHESHPGCLLVEQRSGTKTAAEIVAAVHARGTRVPFVVLLASASVRSVVQAMRAGAFDCLDGSSEPARIVETVLACLERDASRLAHDRRAAGLQHGYDSLTERQRQILELLLDGDTSKGTAYRLGLSKKTVDFHRARILKKLEVRSLVEAATLIYRHRLPGSADQGDQARRRDDGDRAR